MVDFISFYQACKRVNACIYLSSIGFMLFCRKLNSKLYFKSPYPHPTRSSFRRMQALHSLLHPIYKRRAKQSQQRENDRKVELERTLRDRYKSEFSAKGNIKVFTYQHEFAFHFTRFYQSTIDPDFNFYLVEDIRDADVVVFINAINPTVVSENQKVILFFHEPRTYRHLYQSIIPSDFLGDRNITVVSHIEPSEFISGSFFDLPGAQITHIQSIPHVHFHHMASSSELMGLPVEKSKLICSVVSGFNGVPGYEDRRLFLEKLSASIPEFDLFGRYGKIIQRIRSYRGFSAIKYQTIADYKYSLVIENTNEDWYISEKIFDSLMCGCMPIYHGTRKIFDLIPHDWFYYLPDLSDHSVQGINALIRTDQYKNVALNRASIANTIDRSFSFYHKLNQVLATKV